MLSQKTLHTLSAMAFIIFIFVILFTSSSVFTISLPHTYVFTNRHVIDNDHHSAHYVRVGDIDGDGDHDIIGATTYGRYLGWWEYTGSTGTGWSEYKLPGADLFQTSSVDTADMDNYRSVDIVSASYGGHQIIWWNYTKFKVYEYNHLHEIIGWHWERKFIPFIISGAFPGVVHVEAVDMDKDGDNDVIGVSASQNAVSWWENTDSSGLYWNQHTITTSFIGARVVHTTDFDNDGDIDVYGAAQSADDLVWWENIGTNTLTWKRHIIDDNFKGAYDLFAADLNNDGYKDIIATSYIDDKIAWWEYKPTFNEWHKHLIEDRVRGAISIESADFDNDGDNDILCGATVNGTIIVWENYDKGKLWRRHIIDNDFDQGNTVHILDFDKDGDLDFIASAGEEATDIFWWENTKNPPVGPVPTYSVPDPTPSPTPRPTGPTPGPSVSIIPAPSFEPDPEPKPSLVPTLSPEIYDNEEIIFPIYKPNGTDCESPYIDLSLITCVNTTKENINHMYKAYKLFFDKTESFYKIMLTNLKSISNSLGKQCNDCQGLLSNLDSIYGDCAPDPWNPGPRTAALNSWNAQICEVSADQACQPRSCGDWTAPTCIMCYTKVCHRKKGTGLCVLRPDNVFRVPKSVEGITIHPKPETLPPCTDLVLEADDTCTVDGAHITGYVPTQELRNPCDVKIELDKLIAYMEYLINTMIPNTRNALLLLSNDAGRSAAIGAARNKIKEVVNTLQQIVIDVNQVNVGDTTTWDTDKFEERTNTFFRMMDIFYPDSINGVPNHLLLLNRFRTECGNDCGAGSHGDAGLLNCPVDDACTGFCLTKNEFYENHDKNKDEIPSQCEPSSRKIYDLNEGDTFNHVMECLKYMISDVSGFEFASDVITIKSFRWEFEGKPITTLEAPSIADLILVTNTKLPDADVDVKFLVTIDNDTLLSDVVSATLKNDTDNEISLKVHISPEMAGNFLVGHVKILYHNSFVESKAGLSSVLTDDDVPTISPPILEIIPLSPIQAELAYFNSELNGNITNALTDKDVEAIVFLKHTEEIKKATSLDIGLVYDTERKVGGTFNRYSVSVFATGEPIIYIQSNRIIAPKELVGKRLHIMIELRDENENIIESSVISLEKHPRAYIDIVPPTLTVTNITFYDENGVSRKDAHEDERIAAFAKIHNPLDITFNGNVTLSIVDDKNKFISKTDIELKNFLPYTSKNIFTTFFEVQIPLEAKSTEENVFIQVPVINKYYARFLAKSDLHIWLDSTDDTHPLLIYKTGDYQSHNVFTSVKTDFCLLSAKCTKCNPACTIEIKPGCTAIFRYCECQCAVIQNLKM